MNIHSFVANSIKMDDQSGHQPFTRRMRDHICSSDAIRGTWRLIVLYPPRRCGVLIRSGFFVDIG